MKALYFEQHGDIDAMRYGDVSDAVAGPGEALIEVQAAALNHLDIWVRRGWKGLNLEMPHIGGSDICGKIVELNDTASSSKWKIGDRVLVNPGINLVEDEWTQSDRHSVSPGYRMLGEHFRGGFAELAAVPIANLKSIPDELSYVEAGAGALVALTAWRMLFKQGELSKGMSVLVVGAGGGLNSMCIQIASQIGAYVIALTSSKEKEEKAAACGAHQIISYVDEPRWAKAVLAATDGRGVDLVIDNVGAATFPQSLRALCPGGKLLTVGNTSGPEISYDNRLIFTKQISIIGSTMGSPSDFEEALNFLWENGISPVIDTQAPLSDGIHQMQRLESGQQFGKIVLLPSSN